MPPIPRTNQGTHFVIARCPPPTELLRYALQLVGDSEPRDTAHHVSQCASCGATVADLREVASVLQSTGWNATATDSCLDEVTVASVAEQSVDLANRPDLVAHLAACAQCREQVASVSRLLGDPSVATEIRRLPVSAAPRLMRRWPAAGAGALVALAASVLVMVTGSGDRPVVSRPLASAVADTHREQSLTTTVAPNLIAPIGAAAAADTFRWTSVPHADRYRLTLYDRQGTVLWDAEGVDTTMAMPASVAVERGNTYLWKIEARTGWDRWVASELIEFAVQRTGRIP